MDNEKPIFKTQTRLEFIRQELKARGFSKTQIESRVVGGVADIMADTGEFYTNIVDDERKLEKKKRDFASYRLMLNRQTERLEMLRDQLEEDYKSAKEYIESFNQSLADCDTAEGRDTLKAAQMFVNSVDIDSKYDNTAFIIGLSSILSHGKTNGIDELKKMNPKMFEPPKILERV